MRRSRRPVTSRCTNCARYSAGGWRSRVAWAARGRHSAVIVARHKVLRSVTSVRGLGDSGRHARPPGQDVIGGQRLGGDRDPGQVRPDGGDGADRGPRASRPLAQQQAHGLEPG